MDVQEAGQWEVRGGADVGGTEYKSRKGWSECVPGTDRGMAGRGGQGGVGAVYRVGGRGLEAGGAGGRVCVERVYVQLLARGQQSSKWVELCLL